MVFIKLFICRIRLYFYGIIRLKNLYDEFIRRRNKKNGQRDADVR